MGLLGPQNDNRWRLNINEIIPPIPPPKRKKPVFIKGREKDRIQLGDWGSTTALSVDHASFFSSRVTSVEGALCEVPRLQAVNFLHWLYARLTSLIVILLSVNLYHSDPAIGAMSSRYERKSKNQKGRDHNNGRTPFAKRNEVANCCYFYCSYSGLSYINLKCRYCHHHVL